MSAYEERVSMTVETMDQEYQMDVDADTEFQMTVDAAVTSVIVKKIDPDYTGPFSIAPSLEPQIIPTRGHVIGKDITVEAIRSNGDVSDVIGTRDQSIQIPEGYTSGGVVSISEEERSKIVSSNIKKGATILGVSGNASQWNRLHRHTIYNVSTTSTSASSVLTINCGSSVFDKDVIVYVRIRDQYAGRRGYFAGSDNFFINYQNANESTSTLSYGGRFIHRRAADGKWEQYIPPTSSGYGVYAASINSSGVINIYKRYHSTYSLTVDGTFIIDVYTLEYPDNGGIYR